MQYAPDAPTLLNAVAAFLAEDVRPAIKGQDPALAFRVLIAESLCRIAAGELQSEDMLDMMELSRLTALLPDVAGALGEIGRSRPERQRAIGRLNAALAERLRVGDGEPGFRAAAVDHLQQALREKLMVTNPRFDTAMDIERSHS